MYCIKMSNNNTHCTLIAFLFTTEIMPENDFLCSICKTYILSVLLLVYLASCYYQFCTQHNIISMCTCLFCQETKFHPLTALIPPSTPTSTRSKPTAIQLKGLTINPNPDQFTGLSCFCCDSKKEKHFAEKISVGQYCELHFCKKGEFSEKKTKFIIVDTIDRLIKQVKDINNAHPTRSTDSDTKDDTHSTTILKIKPVLDTRLILELSVILNTTIFSIIELLTILCFIFARVST
jgi:hypothetical protein